MRSIFALLLATLPGFAASYPAAAEGDFVVHDFHFRSGETLPELRLHYRTLGTAVRDAQGTVRNAVLILHGTGGAGSNFLTERFAGVLFGPGQLLDATKYFIILPDNVGHGGSTKPSDGLRAKFPHYGYRDMIETQYRLVTEGLKVNHLRLVMGTSMGAMHTWLWGETYPDFMDALMPLASEPIPISGRNRMTRKMIINCIRDDPQWSGGNYKSQPFGLECALNTLFMMTSSPLWLQHEAPTPPTADAYIDKYIRDRLSKTDANDLLYQVESSRDYDPEPGLEKIRAPLFAINSADDEVNPPELGIMEREIKRVKHGRYILLPITPETRGHGTHSLPANWKPYLWELLEQSSKRSK